MQRAHLLAFIALGGLACLLAPVGEPSTPSSVVTKAFVVDRNPKASTARRPSRVEIDTLGSAGRLVESLHRRARCARAEHQALASEVKRLAADLAALTGRLAALAAASGQLPARGRTLDGVSQSH
jgi:hypothetical protein